MTKVSIIVPVYNTEKYLSKCLDSILEQTLSDFEIICVDDCSTDNSIKILEEYQNKDSRIKVLKNEENKGQGYSRNKALECVQGDYIGFIDSDDTIDKTYYEYLYNKAIKENAEITCAGIFYLFENNDQKPGTWVVKDSCEKNTLISIKEKLNRVYKNCSTSACKHLYKRSFIEKNNINFLSGYYHEDQYFNIKAYYYANKIVLEHHDSPVYYYRVHHNSSMQKNKNDINYKKMYFDQFSVFNEIINFIKLRGESDEVIEDLFEYFKIIILNNIRNIDKTLVVEYVEKAKALGFNSETIELFNRKELCNLFKIDKEVRKIEEKTKLIKNLWYKIKNGVFS